MSRDSGREQTKGPLEGLKRLLEDEKDACQSLAVEAQTIVQALARGSRDVRLRRLAQLLAGLHERAGRIDVAAVGEAVDSGLAAVDELEAWKADAAAAALIARLVELPSPGLRELSEAVLDGLMEVTGARRGYVLLCSSESSEAEIVAGKNIESTNLSLAEHACSRTVLAEVVLTGRAIVLDDAESDGRFSDLTSVKQLRLRSVLAVPLRCGERTLGAIYLENSTRAGAFGSRALAAATTVGRFAVFYLRAAGLLPLTLAEEGRVFLESGSVLHDIVGRHESMLRVLDVVRRVADLPATVLIEGESGTGKELFARALHFAGVRRDRPFVALNCAAIPETLMESELFGHERGAFTGATSRQVGRVELAHGGTLFLDEISELAYSLQAKLLRFLQSGELQRVGGRESLRVEVRVVAATSRDLKRLMQAGRFQEALYYRLNVIPLRLPPLRERFTDIPLLIDHFRAKYSALYGKPVVFDEDVYGCLERYPFPGNVRELENVVQRVMALSPGPTIRPGDLPAEIVAGLPPGGGVRIGGLPTWPGKPPSSLQDLRRNRRREGQRLADQERLLAERAIQEAGGNVTLAARRLGCHRVTLHRILRRGGNAKRH